MATSTTKIKQERIDDDYNENDITSSFATYHRYSAPLTSSPVGADSTTTLSSEIRSSVPPPLKRARFPSNESPDRQQAAVASSTNGILRLPSAYEHYEATHPCATLQSLNEMRSRKQLVDLHLVVDGKTIPCHKVVLCGCSTFFTERLLPSTLSSTPQNFNVTETSFSVMSQLVDFSYTSKITITDFNIDHLLSAATSLEFESVRKACIALLIQKLSFDNCISIRRYAMEQGCIELLESACKFICENFTEVSLSLNFKAISLKELLSFLSNNNLKVKLEELVRVYEAAMTWVHHDVTSRKRQLPRILEHVRLPLVQPQFLLDVVQSDSLIKDNKACERFLDEARRFQLLADQRPLMQTTRTQPRTSHCLQKREILVVVGGLNKDKLSLSDCVYFDFPDVSPKFLASFKVKQTAYSVATVNNNIFVTGGAYQLPYKDVWMYIPSLNRWQQVAPMLEARYLHASIELNGCLYVVGGHNGKTRLSSVEKYDPDSNTWCAVEPMTKSLSSTCVVTCEGLLYGIGGATGPGSSEIVADVQCYNPKTNTWQLLAPHPHPQRGAIAANLNGTIYVMGQHAGVYRYNKQANFWVKLRNTNGGHLHGAASVHKGKLYIAGGLHGNSHINGTVEIYEPINDTWHVISTLHVPVYAQGFVSIFKDVTS
uniref:kelch-like protein 2 isoform X1 n=1 Tax=Ciona intestinalis TaxID=7719 RepID=UPI000EF50658|nr:kelch-like protein 2 isoform X1 [Ciona intestinalis]|eukprot:XP_026694339.1 kelch-like protein 2 isoform X1 [Ciona intestinalis]